MSAVEDDLPCIQQDMFILTTLFLTVSGPSGSNTSNTACVTALFLPISCTQAHVPLRKKTPLLLLFFCSPLYLPQLQPANMTVPMETCGAHGEGQCLCVWVCASRDGSRRFVFSVRAAQRACWDVEAEKSSGSDCDGNSVIGATGEHILYMQTQKQTGMYSNMANNSSITQK